VDDGSPSRTIQIAKQVARVAVTRKKEGQTKGVLYRMQLAEYTMIITIEPTTGNNPKAYRTCPIE
jgi:predicted CoA-binding protein